MNYKIQAIFATESEANSASSLLHAAGYRKEFLGYTQNAHLQPESLVEDHHIDKNYVTVFTKNLNRAFKARNILSRIGAVSIKMKHQFSQKQVLTRFNSRTQFGFSQNFKYFFRIKKNSLENTVSQKIRIFATYNF